MTPEAFVDKWRDCPGSERGNYAVFLTELTQVLGVPPPGPTDDYRIDMPIREGSASGQTGYADLYKRDAFVLEAKQSRQSAAELAQAQPALFDTPEQGMGEQGAGEQGTGERGAGNRYDATMRAAFAQARRYARNVPLGHPIPPFLLLLDVGRNLELYFDYSGDGRDYRFFPDRESYRLPIERLLEEDTRALLATVWTDPRSLDPALRTADVTRKVASRLSFVAKYLEEQERRHVTTDAERSEVTEETSLFLMRVLFCMFAEDARLLSDDPDKRPFKAFLKETETDDATFRRGLADLWTNMGAAGRADRWTFAFREPVRYFNGSLFAETRTYSLSDEMRFLLLEAARYEWKDVEPAIFGTLLEQALTPDQRGRLGAHYTPRAYVERIVEATMTEVLRAKWEAVEAGLADLSPADALASLAAFHDRLAGVTVLDPACGTGNFLYVAMEALLALEAQLIETVEALGGAAESRVGPAQFHGLEKNPRAAKIAELVLWIGWLRWTLKQGTAAIHDPVLDQRANINFGRPGGYDAVLAQDELGRPDLADPRRPVWPAAEFIVGNPPFIGGKDVRGELGGDYAEALWAANPRVPASADLVMHWWDRAADLLTRPDTALRRFGFVTTNSITQAFSRRVIEAHLAGKEQKGLHLHLAIPDHPWTKATRDAAAVRIAMTVAAPGPGEGRLMEVAGEAALDTDAPEITFEPAVVGRINANLGVGPDPSEAVALRANEGLSSRGVSLHGAGFIVTPERAWELGLGTREGLERHIRAYRNGRDLMGRPRGVMVIDLFGLSEAEVRTRFPEVYQHLLRTVKPERQKQFDKSATNDARAYLESYWVHGKPRPILRGALAGLPRYIATVETAKHRVFQFLDAAILPDNKLLAIGSDDAFHLGVLSSRAHLSWYLATAGMIGVYSEKAVYVKTKAFEPFPFPDATPDQRAAIAALAEELDATRAAALVEVPGLTMTEIYNWRARIAAPGSASGAGPGSGSGAGGEALSGDDGRRATAARAWIVHDLHTRLDAAVAAAYGWPAEAPPADLVARLVVLNAERAAEEAAGHVRWLRPAYQRPRFKDTPA